MARYNPTTGQLIIDSTNLNLAFLGSVVPSSALPVVNGDFFVIATEAGTYTNFGSKVVSANSRAEISRVGGVFSISQTPLDITSKVNVSDVINTLVSTETTKPGSANNDRLLNEKIAQGTPNWSAKAFLINDETIHSGKLWQSNAATLSTDVPGTSSKWVERLGYAHLTVGKNLFDGTYVEGYFNNGVYTPTTGFKASDFIAIESSTDYYLSGRNNQFGTEHLRIVFFDVNKVKLAGTFSGGYNTPLGGVYCPSPATAKYIRFGIDHPNGVQNLPAIQLELGNVATSYQAYTKRVAISELPLNVATTENVYTKEESQKVFAPIVGKNLFNKATITQAYVIGASGLVSGDAGTAWHVSDFITVEPSSTYFLSGRINTNSDAGGIGLYDASKTVIPFSSAMFPDSVTTNFWVNENGRVVTPSNCVYVRFTVDRLKPENKDTIQFEKGSIGTSYWPYDKLLVPYKYLPISEPVAETLVKWEAIGDSMTYLNNALADTQGRVTKGYMTQTVEKIPRLSYVNRGYNGYQSSSIAGTVGTWQLADIYSILLTTNDWAFGSRTIGTIADYINNTGSGTVFGAYRIMTDRIYTLNPTALIILITPPQRGDFVYIADKTNNAIGSYTIVSGKTLSQFADAVIEIAKYMAIPLVDLYYNSGFNQRSVVKYKRLKHPTTGVYTNYTYPDFVGVAFNSAADDYPYPVEAIGMTYDGLHPSDKGNEVIAQMIANEIQKHLKI